MADADELLGMDRADLTLLASDTADRAGAGQRAVELAKATLDLLDADADPVRAGLVHSRLAYYLWVRGDSQAAIAEHRAAVAMVPADPPSVIRSRVVGGLAGILMPTGHYGSRRSLPRKPSPRSGPLAPPKAARLLNVVGVDLVGLGDVDTGLEHLREAVRTAREPGQLDSLMGAIHNLGFFLAQTDRLEEAFAVTTDGLETARRVGLQRRFGGGLRATMGDILNRSGRWEEVEQVTREGLEDEVDSSGSIYLRATRAMVFAARGDLAAADEDLRAAALGAADVDPDVQAYVLQAQAERALIDGRVAPPRCASSRRDWPSTRAATNTCSSCRCSATAWLRRRSSPSTAGRSASRRKSRRQARLPRRRESCGDVDLGADGWYVCCDAVTQGDPGHDRRRMDPHRRDV